MRTHQLTLSIHSAMLAADTPVKALPTDGVNDMCTGAVEQAALHHTLKPVTVTH